MKKLVLLLALVAAANASAQVVVGPLSQLTTCPSSASSETKGKDKFCVFRDPAVVQVLQSRCPSSVGAKGTHSTAGKTEWCVIRR